MLYVWTAEGSAGFQLIMMSCYAEAIMSAQHVGFFVLLAYVALIVFVVWQVIWALIRISRATVDIAQTLRRMELKRQDTTPHT
jgi:hypothetical protein